MSINDALGFLFQGYTPSVILAVLGVLLIIRQRLAIQLGPKEPPILKPRIPYIGTSSDYFDIILHILTSCSMPFSHGVMVFF
jgi:hypothetical protein